jgi:Protein of unknown function (DUF3592)
MNDQPSPEENRTPTSSSSPPSSRPAHFWPTFWGILLLLGAIFFGAGRFSAGPKRPWPIVWRVLLGLILMGWGGLFIWQTLSFLPGSISAQGTVLSCGQTLKDGSCKLRVSFETSSGERREFTAYGYQDKGDLVTVWYHPENPNDATLGRWPNPGAIIFFIAGLLFVIFNLLGDWIVRLFLRTQRE